MNRVCCCWGKRINWTNCLAGATDEGWKRLKVFAVGGQVHVDGVWRDTVGWNWMNCCCCGCTCRTVDRTGVLNTEGEATRTLFGLRFTSGREFTDEMNATSSRSSRSSMISPLSSIKVRSSPPVWPNVEIEPPLANLDTPRFTTGKDNCWTWDATWPPLQIK